jgi:serine/threonine-protein kinase
MSDVFISYKAEDRKRIQPLVQALQADGYSVWWDEHIGTGDEWRQTIEQQLDSARCVIVIWSKGSVGPEGHFVRDEASRAQRRHIYVPVMIDAVSPPLGFGESQATSLKGWKGDRSDHRYEAVHSAVRHIAGPGSATAHSQPAHQTPVSRRAVMAGGGVAVIAVAGVGAWELLKPSSASAAGGIAVLPFANLSGDPQQTYFSDGLAEEIRSALTRLPGLKVIGRSSSEAVRNDDAQTAAKKLDVATILTGSVRQSPSTIRVTAELIDGKTGVDKWSQDYDRSPGDTIKIQTDIAQNVATALGAALGQAARAAVTIGGTNNAAAQDLYLKARAQIHADDSEQSLRTGLGYLDSALALDPKFADAYALKSRLLGDLNGYYLTAGTSYGPGYVQAAAVARQAISLAPNLASGHTALAYILLSQLNMGGAAAEYERSHALAGGNADDLLAYATFVALLGKTDESIDISRQAQASDPLNPGPYASEASAQLNAARNAQAVAAYQKALSLAPNRLVNRAFLGAALMNLAKYDEARAEINKLPPDYLFRLVDEAILSARQGNLAASDAALTRVQQINGDEANYQYAEIYTQRGEKDKAFAALERAWTFRDPGLAYMYSDGWLRPLRGDPRFTALLKKMNFPT